VIDSDRILVFHFHSSLSSLVSFLKVLGHGELLEFDAPNVLLSNPNSHFTSLVEQTGAAEAEHLRTLASVSSTDMKVEHQTFNSADELLEENNEHDPLLSSHEKIQ
jgi:ABC-type proline/glycine betaine transport system ATPase subunit